MEHRLPLEFYLQDVLVVAPSLLGQKLVCRHSSGFLTTYTISETEAYRGTEDKACHASKGMTARTKVMFAQGGVLYMYLIYGMYWMMNVVTGARDVPQAVLIRGLREVSGPGRLTKALGLNGSFNGEDLLHSERIWIEGTGREAAFTTHPRIGIDYAGEVWKNKPWRYLLKQDGK
ncbi:MAG: DNA-3-methyladenine glycosylase [Bacteroidales bacterium]|nr:DNA-3-methyladenine glycosylase [Bacteroidales bacterium]MDT8432740.1 DNA-3-methyladenine glycosylase [Bacteroidales bacterium]